jgi:hypothetical protein
LFICDPEGNLRSWSKGALPLVFESEQVPEAPEERRHFAELFGSRSKLTLWLAEQASQCREREDYLAETDLEYRGNIIHVRLLALTQADQPFGFAVQISDGNGGLPEGASVVTRQQWHDINNQLGGIKLYATFLRKRASAGEDEPIVEKILGGINGLIDHLTRVRRGE